MSRFDIDFGLGLRHEHYEQIAESPGRVSWFEALSQNYMVTGGNALHWLALIRRDYPNHCSATLHFANVHGVPNADRVLTAQVSVST